MPTVTFSSRLHKDKTVYAVAGSYRKTILELAKENHVPIDFSCGNGECGTCLVNLCAPISHPLGTNNYFRESVRAAVTANCHDFFVPVAPLRRKTKHLCFGRKVLGSGALF